ncbi:MAG: hypothetical protein ACJAXK_000613 [Yoonia sp.]|jgi:hypothetical protein
MTIIDGQGDMTAFNARLAAVNASANADDVPQDTILLIWRKVGSLSAS